MRNMTESKHFTNEHEGMIMLQIVLSALLLSQASSQSPDGQDFSLAVTIPGVQYFICELWFNVDCDLADTFYGLNQISDDDL